MTRRAFATLAAAVFVSPTRPRRFGAISVARHAQLRAQGIDLHVWVAGVDVTRRCRFADDTGDGWAELLKHNADGRPYLGADGEIAREIVRGICVREGPP